MKKNAFLIRTTKGNSSRLDIINVNMKKYPNIKYFFIEERYGENFFVEEVSENHILIGNEYLFKNNLEVINKTGWQCGDYALYAGYDYYKGYDNYWIVDDDLCLNLDLNKFIEVTNKIDCDCLALDYRLASKNWYWHKTLSNQFENVYGMLFGLARFSKKAVAFLKESRVQYHPELTKEQLNSLFSNDESFCATYLSNNNFKCLKIQDILPEYFSNNLFSLSEKPILLEELDFEYTKDQIIHPLCQEDIFVTRLNKLKKDGKIDAYFSTMYRIYINFGLEKTNNIFKTDCVDLLSNYFKSKLFVNLKEISEKYKVGLTRYCYKSWFYNQYCYVLDFNIDGHLFALDITAGGNINFVARNDKAKKLSKILFNNRDYKNTILYNSEFLNVKFRFLRIDNAFEKNIENLIRFIKIKIMINKISIFK